ncbi:MAG: DUF86 domain-containing protein [Phycisphaerae bacterium]
MLDHAREVREMIKGCSRSELESDRKLNLALTRLMEIIGEAAVRTPDSFRKKHPEIPWSEIAALRNRLIHGYDRINLDVLWAIIRDDIPPLTAQLQHILESEIPEE